MVESIAALTLSGTTQQQLDGGILRGQRKQSFAFSDKIMCYIAMNPASPNIYKKLILTCKFFNNINPILVVRCLKYGPTDIDSEEYEWRVSLKESEDCIRTPPSKICFFQLKYELDMDITPYKIWITKSLTLRPPEDEMNRTFAATFIQTKLFRSEADYVRLNKQVLTFDEFSLLGSNAAIYWSHRTLITESDRKCEVLLEKIIEKLPKLRNFLCECTASSKFVSSDTVKELLKLQHFNNITAFRMYNIPNELFDAKALFDYVKKCKNMHVTLYYELSEISANFKKQLDEIVDEVLSTKVYTYKPPRIYYIGIDADKSTKMGKTACRYEDSQF